MNCLLKTKKRIITGKSFSKRDDKKLATFTFTIKKNLI